MTIQLAHRTQKLAPSATLKINGLAQALKSQGKPVISLGIGEPDFDTPEFIKAAAIEAIHKNFTHYTANEGTLELRQAIADKFKRENQLEYTPKQILVSNGAKQLVYNACQVLLNPGDEVIIPAPYWVSYPVMVELTGAKPVYISAGIEQSFKITPAQLEKTITPKTKLFILNSPSNPTGMAYTSAELKALGDVLSKHPNVVILTDDIYEHMLWSGKCPHFLNVSPELTGRTLVCNGASKSYAMTGWRIGYAAGPLEIINAMNDLQSHSTSNACSISQAAALAALKGGLECVDTMRKAYKERHDFCLAELKKMSGVECLPTDGTFYLFPKVLDAMRQKGIKTDLELSSKILEEMYVAVVPGSGFGAEGYIRLSIATRMENLREAMKRFHSFFNA